MADSGRDLHREEPVAKKLAADFSGKQSNESNSGITGDQSANNNNGGTALPENIDQYDKSTATNGKGHSDCEASEPMDISGEEHDGEEPNDKMEGNTINTGGAGGDIDEMDAGTGGQGVSQAASAGGSTPVLTLDQGREKKRNDRYPIDDRGMLVVITNTVFAYEYTEGKMTTKDLRNGKKRSDDVFGTSRARHKSAGDVDKTKPGIMNMLKRFFCCDGNADFFVQKKLTPADRNDLDPIDALINDLKERVENVGKRPKFLLFVLMSAGLKHGQFLLHSNNQHSCTCKDVHALKSSCRGRRVADLVHKIQEAEGGIFSDIPKILLIQTISGQKQFESFDKAVPPKRAPPPKVLDPDDFIPRGSDTFVYYVHTDYFASCGFYMLELFCDAIDKLKGKITQCRGMLCDVDKVWGRGKEHKSDESLDQVLQRVSKALKAEQLVQDLELEGESLVEGWLDDMMTTVSARIDQHLKSKQFDKVNTSQMRAHISSTLRKRVSMIDILRENV